MPPAPASSLRRWLLVGLLFAALHQATTLQLWFSALARDPAAPWLDAAVVEASLWLPWLALLPLVAWNCRRHRLDGGGAAVLRHALLAAGIIGLHLLLMPLTRSALESLLPGAPAASPYGRSPALGLVYLQRLASYRGLAWTAGDLLWYALLASGWYALDSRERLREKELREAQLKAQATRAHLDALRHRLEPHFFFNALNALSALIRTEPSQAEAMLDALAGLFRRVLGHPGHEAIPLGEELDIARAYLDVERFRFGDDLDYRLELPAELASLPVPPLILQPLVENALKHGIAPKGAPGTIRVQARREEGQLEIAVEDDGTGGVQPGHGIGLDATRQRLATLYGEAAGLEAGPLPQGGYRAVLRLPG